MSSNKSAKLSRRFYRQKTQDVAKSLLGKRLVYKIGRQRLSGRIVETEAYLGLSDPACHSYHGKRTPRTETFYLDGGYSYVYLIYGMYHCFNIITRSPKEPEAVLIRAIEPDEGVARMQINRPVKREKDLANGPGKLCQAMGFNLKHNALDLTGQNLFIEDPKDSLARPSQNEIFADKRVGIDSYGGLLKLEIAVFFFTIPTSREKCRNNGV